MLRGLILATLAFGVVFLASRQFDSVAKDIARYDGIRAMSGDPPLWRQLATMALKQILNASDDRPHAIGDAAADVAEDVLRYATIRSM